MDRNHVSPIIVAAALSACALEPEQLNSERILQRFGSYGIEVLEQNEGVRRSNLYSTEDGVRTCRTYAVVRFAGDSSTEFADAHENVLAGRSIGATFRESGWSIDKNTVYIGSIASSTVGADVSRLMQLGVPRDLGIHVYELILERDDESIHYATIVELHHPDYLSVGELRELYDGTSDDQADADSIAAFVALLQSD